MRRYQIYNISLNSTEILVLGLGDKVVQLSPDVWTYLRQQKLPFEILDTVSAGNRQTLNFL